MVRTYREVAIEEMLLTVEEAMSRVIDWWGDLPPPMKDAIEQFRSQLEAAIDSVEFVKRALDRVRAAVSRSRLRHVAAVATAITLASRQPMRGRLLSFTSP